MSLRKPISVSLIDSQAISDFCSDSKEFCFSYDWHLQVVKSGANGNPLLTFEVSDDNVNWDNYDDCAVDVEMTGDSITFKDDMLSPRYVRLCVKSNGVTTGSISANMFLKGK